MKATVHEVSNCALQCIKYAADLIVQFPSEFDAALKPKHGISNSAGINYYDYKGCYFTATMVVLTSDHPNYAAAVPKLQERGFKLVAKFPGAHQNDATHRDYLNEIWIKGAL